MLNYFGPENLKELLEAHGFPSASIYMQVEGGAASDADALRFRAAVGKVRSLLASAENGAHTGILGALDTLQADTDFWPGSPGSLAVFAADGFLRSYRLPADFRELATVGPAFHTRPMVEYLQAPGRYWVLSLSQKDVRLWQGSSRGLVRFESKRLPTSLEAALGDRVVKDRLNYHSAGPGSSPVYHGHGAGKDDAKQELEKFFRAVDGVLVELLDGQLDPVVLAAVDYLQPIYRSISRLGGSLAEDGIHGNVSDWDADRLHQAAWPIASRRADAWIDEALGLWEQSFGRGKTESDLAAAFRFGVAGRIRALLTESSRLIWGRLDRSTGEVTVLGENGSDPDPAAADLLNELAGLTIRHRGKALVVPAERMPTGTGLAAILR